MRSQQSWRLKARPTQYFTFLHVSPEAAVGGTIALVKNGDPITLDADKGLIQLGVTGAEIKRRRASWKPWKPRYKDGVLAEYAAHVSSASEGAILT
jgi:dihydroxy-acid dehydratase